MSKLLKIRHLVGTFFTSGLAFLVSVFFFCFLHDGYSFLLGMLLFLLLPTAIIIHFVSWLWLRTKATFYPLLVNLIVVALLVPTIKLGGYCGEQLFLKHLARFQQVTDTLIQEAKKKIG